MAGEQISWVRGQRDQGPTETIGVLEVRADGRCRAVFAERAEVDGRCHILLARQAWGSKDSLDTRWWSLVLNRSLKASYVRNGSCGDSVTTADIPRIVRAIEELGLVAPDTMIVVDDGPSAFPWLGRVREGS